MSEAPTLTRHEKAKADLSALLRARNCLLWIVTREERRVELATMEAAAQAQFSCVYWDCAAGFTAPTGEALDARAANPVTALQAIAQQEERTVYVMRDLHAALGNPVVTRTVRNLAKSLQNRPRTSACAIVILSPLSEVPPELAGHAKVIDWPLPERREVAQILDAIVDALPEEAQTAVRAQLVNGERERAIDSAIGLEAEEVASTYRKSLVTLRNIDPSAVALDKKALIAGTDGLIWTDPDPRGMDSVGGLDNLKSWLQTRRGALSQKAREYGLPVPRGVLLVGVPGCGKSLMAKCIASAWKIPLLRADAGAFKDKFVGESEKKVRKAFAKAEAIAPAVLWIDEIEKALGGASGALDGGVSTDQLGTMLTWMQEHTAPVFVVATANSIDALPPELLRAGRLDAIFFVDLPTRGERRAILTAALKNHKRDPQAIDLDAVAAACDGYSGAEIASIVPDAMFAAFADNARDLTTDDLLTAARAVVPLSRTASGKIAALREWARGNARPATTPDTTTAAAPSLDM